MASNRCPRVGAKVRFAPNPAARMFYTHSDDPKEGAEGVVVAVPLGGGRRSTCMPGPRGGLVYVNWAETGVSGAFKPDLQFLGRRKKA